MRRLCRSKARCPAWESLAGIPFEISARCRRKRLKVNKSMSMVSRQHNCEAFFLGADGAGRMVVYPARANRQFSLLTLSNLLRFMALELLNFRICDDTERNYRPSWGTPMAYLPARHRSKKVGILLAFGNNLMLAGPCASPLQLISRLFSCPNWIIFDTNKKPPRHELSWAVTLSTPLGECRVGVVRYE